MATAKMRLVGVEEWVGNNLAIGMSFISRDLHLGKDAGSIFLKRHARVRRRWPLCIPTPAHRIRRIGRYFD